MFLVRSLPTAAAPAAKATQQLREAAVLEVSQRRSANAFGASNVHSARSRVSQAGPEAWDDEVSQTMKDLMQRKPEKKRKLMDAINQFRAQVCAQMKNENGKKFGSYEECRDFMKKACNPGKDRTMDGDSKEITTRKGYCSEFFSEAEKKAKKKVEMEEPAEEPSSPGLDEEVIEAPGLGPSPGAAPSPGTMGAPGPAPGPSPASGPFVPGLSKGPPPIPPGNDEKYYFAKGGKDKARVHMDEKLKLPAQGYFGKLVEHQDGETATRDWQKEWTHDTYGKFCAQQPDNPWCEGYHRGSAAAPHGCSVMLLPLTLMALRA